LHVHCCQHICALRLCCCCCCCLCLTAGKEYGKDASQEAYAALMQSGLTFIDTAEVRAAAMTMRSFVFFSPTMCLPLAPDLGAHS
jgi:hypothetical protein